METRNLIQLSPGIPLSLLKLLRLSWMIYITDTTAMTIESLPNTPHIHSRLSIIPWEFSASLVVSSAVNGLLTVMHHHVPAEKQFLTERPCNLTWPPPRNTFGNCWDGWVPNSGGLHKGRWRPKTPKRLNGSSAVKNHGITSNPDVAERPGDHNGAYVT